MREPRDNNAHATGTEDDNDSPAVGLLRLNVLPERLVEEQRAAESVQTRLPAL